MQKFYWAALLTSNISTKRAKQTDVYNSLNKKGEISQNSEFKIPLSIYATAFKL